MVTDDITEPSELLIVPCAIVGVTTEAVKVKAAAEVEMLALSVVPTTTLKETALLDKAAN